jgi:asparagine synthase (glutamine-hydrolysing)
LAADVPAAILARRDKIGFITAESKWFREEMSFFLKDIFSSVKMNNRPFYDSSRLKGLLELHLSGKADVSRPIWRALNLELWLRKYMD